MEQGKLFVTKKNSKQSSMLSYILTSFSGVNINYITLFICISKQQYEEKK